MRTFDLTQAAHGQNTDGNDDWAHQIGAAVQLVLSHEQGNVIGRYHAAHGEDIYDLVYVNGAGCQVRGVWGESWIEPIKSDLN